MLRITPANRQIFVSEFRARCRLRLFIFAVDHELIIVCREGSRIQQTQQKRLVNDHPREGKKNRLHFQTTDAL